MTQKWHRSPEWDAYIAAKKEAQRAKLAANGPPREPFFKMMHRRTRKQTLHWMRRHSIGAIIKAEVDARAEREYRLGLAEARVRRVSRAMTEVPRGQVLHE